MEAAPAEAPIEFPLVIRGRKGLAALLALGALPCLLVYPLVAWLGVQSLMAACAGMAGGWALIAMALHEGSLRITVELLDDAVKVTRSSLLWTTDHVFTNIKDVTLARRVRGHGARPLSPERVRRDYEDYVGPKAGINGLFISSGARAQHVDLHMPLPSLLALTDVIRRHAEDLESRRDREDPALRR